MVSSGRSALFVALVLACTGCAGAAGSEREGAGGVQAGAPTPPERATQRHDKPVELTLVAAGDVLPHGPLNDSAARGDGFDYSPLLAGIDPWVQGADLALCHLEAPVAPPGTAPSGYPVFGAPRQLVADLAEQGWDGCSTASNHSADRAFAGITATLNAFDDHGLGHVGTARHRSERAPQLYTFERAGRSVTIAHLSVTYGLNGLPVPGGRPWSVDLLEPDRIVAEARRARADGADVVVVSMHAGLEYTAEATDEQRSATRRLARSGEVDLVIGHHAHIPQQIVRLDGGPGGGTWVAYGLGNMISNQSAECCDARTSNGVLLTATLTQGSAGDPVRVDDVTWTATTVDRLAGHRLRTVTEDGADASGGTPGAAPAGRLTEAELRARHAAVRDVVGPAAGERTAPPAPTGDGPALSR